MAMDHGMDKSLSQAKIRQYISKDETGLGSKRHYEVFQGLREKEKKKKNGGGGICAFKALVIEAASMSNRVTQLMHESP